MRLFKKKNDSEILPKITLSRLAMFFSGMMLYSIAFNLIFYPLKVVIGGISGLSIVVNNFYDIEPFLFILTASLSLLVLGFIFLKKKTAMSYIIGSVSLPIFIKGTEYIKDYLVFEETDKLILVIFGAVLSGVGAGLIAKSGFLTSEKDIISEIAMKKFKVRRRQVTQWTTILIVAAGGLITTSVTYNFSNIMYAIVAIYTSGLLYEKVLIGISNNKTFYIFTEEVEKVREFIIDGFDTSLTVMKATGAFTNNSKTVLMCVIQTRDYFKIKEGLKLIDKEAFFIATDAYETSYKKVKRGE